MDDPVSNYNNESPMSFIGVRGAAVKILSRFERSDAYLEKLLIRELSVEGIDPRDKSLMTELVNGVIRWKWKLDWILAGFYMGDYLKCLNLVKNSMRVALYQILFLDRIPIPAAINESVEIVKRIQGEKTAGIVNAVLRNISRNIENIRYPDREEDVSYYFTVMYSHPRWMVRRWLERFGEEGAEKLLMANNRKPFIPIRVNRMKCSKDEIINFLNDKNIPFFISNYYPNSITLKSPRLDISSLPIFKDGMITVQDTGATLCALLASPKPGMNVVDLCAAPGGKSFFMAELMENQGKILAIDKYSLKLKNIEDGARRLGFDIIETLTEDAAEVSLPEQVDIAYADVPCSGLGTISKKPDIKWKREREDIYKLTSIQRDILANASKLVKPGGVLLYSTCTIEEEENYENIAWFLQNYPDYELDPAEKYLPAELCSKGCMQSFPHIHGIDGAFAARLVRKK